MKTKNILYITILILVSPIALSTMFHFNEDFDPTIQSWYTVEPWEIEYCRKWGGKKSGAGHPGDIPDTKLALSQLTMSMQGEKMTYDRFGELSNQSTLYRVSWYIEPASEDAINYKLFLQGETSLEIANGTASNSNPAFGFYAKYINKSFDSIKLEGTGIGFRVPIIDVSP